MALYLVLTPSRLFAFFGMVSDSSHAENEPGPYCLKISNVAALVEGINMGACKDAD